MDVACWWVMLRFLPAALVVLVVMACSPTSTLGRPSSPLARFYQQRLSWHTCSGGECATLTVPLDYERPSGRTISVAVIRIPATDQRHRIGALLLNPGGPGASGIEYAREAAQVFPSSLRARFDLVGFDPRGVGESAPVECLSDKELDAFTEEPAYPLNAQQQSQLVSQARALARACGRRDGAMLDHVSSADVARDMDILRAALGQQRLIYYGASYGTFLGTVYEELFPGRIREMVLDSALDPELSSAQEDLQQAQSFDHLLSLFLAWCVTQPNCALGSTEVTARTRLDGLLQQVAQQPLPGRGGRLVGTGPFLTALAAAMYSPTDGFPVLNAALGLALAGNGALLLALADALNGRGPNGHYSNLIEANYAVGCVDRPHPTSVQSLAAEASQALTVAPFFGAAIVWGELPCVFWPAKPALRPRPAPPSPTPILVIATRDDPATPYQWGVSLVHELGDARLLTFAGEGHVAFGRGDPCVDAAVVAYLTTAALPAPGSTCPA
jgi:pimeloyl-ACP methyl ester carboxylesterase